MNDSVTVILLLSTFVVSLPASSWNSGEHNASAIAIFGEFFVRRD
jgi:hypothetical protein